MVSEPRELQVGARSAEMARPLAHQHADCPDFCSAMQASGRHVYKEVLVCRPGLL